MRSQGLAEGLACRLVNQRRHSINPFNSGYFLSLLFLTFSFYSPKKSCYQYSLIVDGKLIGTKQMILAK